MKTRSIILLLMCALTMSTAAQSNRRLYRSITQDTTSIFVQRYVDSLLISKQRIDSLMYVSNSLGTKSNNTVNSYRLLMPPTFYYNIAEDNFSLSDDATVSMVDDALLSMYLHRPDLIEGSQRQLEQAGNIISPTAKVVVPNVDIVEKVESNVPESVVAPVDIIVKKPNFWKFSGDFSLQANQNYLSTNWYQSGESNYTAHAAVTLKANYNNRKKFVWENTLELKLGVTNTHSDTVHHVRVNGDNIMRYTGKIGIQASSKWKYTFQLIATTQMFRQYKSNDETVYSDFISPLTVNPSIGMDYTVNWLKGKLTGSVNMAPLAYNMTYYKRDDIAVAAGLEEGTHFVDDYGSQITTNLKWVLTKDVSWSVRMYFYTSYQRCLFECENTFNFAVNKYLSSTISVYPRFDDSRTRDDHHGYWHFKEYLSFGLSYSI